MTAKALLVMLTLPLADHPAPVTDAVPFHSMTACQASADRANLRTDPAHLRAVCVRVPRREGSGR